MQTLAEACQNNCLEKKKLNLLEAATIPPLTSLVEWLAFFFFSKTTRILDMTLQETHKGSMDISCADGFL
jgi:hypothetical protein